MSGAVRPMKLVIIGVDLKCLGFPSQSKLQVVADLMSPNRDDVQNRQLGSSRAWGPLAISSSPADRSYVLLVAGRLVSASVERRMCAVGRAQAIAHQGAGDHSARRNIGRSLGWLTAVGEPCKR